MTDVPLPLSLVVYVIISGDKTNVIPCMVQLRQVSDRIKVRFDYKTV